MHTTLEQPNSVTDLAGANRSHAAEALFDVFNRLDRDTLHLLDEVYAHDVVFIDPAHEVRGLPALKAHMAGLYDGVLECRREVVS